MRQATSTRGRDGRLGFTLVEMIVTLTVAAILAAVTIPNLLAWYQSYKATERQADAELIYTTAQNNMAQLKANGQLADVQNNTTAVTDSRVTLASTVSGVSDKTASQEALNNDDGIIALSSDDDTAKDALALLVPNIDDALSRVGYSSMSYSTAAHYRIELNPTTGYVYRAYFSEDAISNDEVSGKSDDELVAEGIGAYGNTVPKTFKTEKKQPACWVGYFEFAKDGNATSATGGYFYQIYQDNTTSDSAIDRLHDNNRIDEGAVDSTDGTAYGVMVPKSRVDDNSFTPPTSFTKRYEVQLTNELDTPGQETDCYFYELGAPASNHEGWASYTVTYHFHSMLGFFSFGSTSYSDLQAPVGSTVSVTNDDLARLGWFGLLFGLGEGSPTPTATVQADGSTNLDVDLYLLRSGQVSKPSGDDTTQSILPDGTGAWKPWSTSTDDRLKDKAFYINQNFAGCIVKGDQEPSDTSTYQVRTDDQLQHIGSPYGSTPQQPNTNYLSHDFYQTHDITINQAWSPIGQDQANGIDDGASRFSGHFYGSYAGAAQDTLDDASSLSLAQPTDDSRPFTITLSEREGQTDDNLRRALFNADPAYNTTSGYRSYGIFGYVTGGISHAHVSMGTEDTGFDLAQSLNTPHYGTLVGDLTGEGSIDHATVAIPKSSSMRVREDGYNNAGRSTDDSILGGLCGYLGDDATIHDSSLTLEDNAATDSEPRLELTTSAQGDITRTVNVGGLVGRASCNKKEFLSNCTVVLGDDATMSAKGVENRQVYAGGFVGYATEQSGDESSIATCDMTVGGTLTVDTSQDSWTTPVYAGGFAGNVSGVSEVSDVTSSGKGNVVVNAKALGSPSHAGGMFGSLNGAKTLKNVRLGTAENVSANGTVTATTSADTMPAKVTVSATSQNQNTNAYAGGVFGQLSLGEQPSTVDTATVNAGELDVTASVPGSSSYAGGVMGQLDLGEQASTVKTVEAATTGNLNLTATSQGATSYVGGAMGLLSLNNTEATIDTVTTQAGGNLTIADMATGSTSYAGGTFGQATNATGRAKASHVTVTATGNVTISKPDQNQDRPNDAYMAGLAGQLEAIDLSDSSATFGRDATVDADANEKAYVGGLVGQDRQGDITRGDGTNTSLHVTGALRVTGSGQYNGGNDGLQTGGLVGSLEGNAKVASPTLEADTLSVTATHANNSPAFAGGLVGHASGNDSGNPTIANASINVTGDVAINSTASSVYATSGLLAGQLESTAVDGVTANVGGSLNANATDSNGASARAAGLVAQFEDGSSLRMGQLTVARDLNAIAESTDGSALAGGLVGYAASNPKPLQATGSLTVNGSLTVRGNAKNSQDTFSGALAGQLRSVGFDGPSVTVDGGLTSTAASVTGSARSGGLVGEMVSNDGVDPAALVGETSTLHGMTVSASGNGGARAGGLVGHDGSAAISNSPLAPHGNLSVSASSTNSATFAGGYIGSLESATVSDSSLSPTGSLTVNAGNTNSPAYAGGFAGQASSSSTIARTSIRAAGDINVTSDGSSTTYAGGALGQANSVTLNDSAFVPGANLSVTSTSSNGGSYAGGLIGQASSLTASNNALQPAAGVTVSSANPAENYAGGLMGQVSDSNLSYLSLLESASAHNVAVTVSGDSRNSGWGKDSCVAGGFGSTNSTSIDNSYVVTRNVPLVLNNRGNGNGTFTGGFAGNATNGSITTSYVSADIRSDSNRGISGFVDNGDSLQVRADHIIATMTAGDQSTLTDACAFSRQFAFEDSSNWMGGDYAIVTSEDGSTPYPFLSHEESHATPACCIYDANATDPTPGTPTGDVGDRINGAHPVTLTWLAGNAPYTDEYNQTFDSDNPYHYRNIIDYLSTKNGGLDRYPYVMGNGVAPAFNDGGNPFPTATKDKDGNYINYGTWPAAPATSTDTATDSETDSTGSETTTPDGTQNATNTGASNGNESATAQNQNANATNGAAANGSSNTSASQSADANASAVANASTPAGGSSPASGPSSNLTASSATSADSSPSNDAASNGNSKGGEDK